MPARGLQPDVISYNSVLSALHTSGEDDDRAASGSNELDADQRLQRVRTLLDSMKAHGPAPDTISYGTAITAAAKA